MFKRYMGVLLVLMVVSVAFAEVPKTISHQGLLTDSNGNAVPDDNYDLTFTLSTSPNNSAQLWEETHQAVAVENGLFNVILGSITPLDLPFDDVYYLGVSVNGGAELMPRIPLTSSPYSLNVTDSAAVKSLNTLRGNVTLEGGENVSIATNGNTIMISSTGNGTGLTLPFNGTVADDIFAFRVSNTGNGVGILGESAGPNSAVSGINSGAGPAGSFTVANSGSGSAAISATTEGVGNTATFTHTGTDGHIASFRATNANNNESAVSIETENGWTAMEVVNNAENGLAGYFLLANDQSTQIGVLSQNRGTGPAIWGDAQGNGIGVKASSTGSGAALNAENIINFSKVAEFIDTVEDNTEPAVTITAETNVLATPALKVEHTGRGTAGRFENTNTTEASGSAIFAVHNGPGVAVQGAAQGSGITAVGIWAQAPNGSDALPLKATQNGSGDNIATFQSQNLNVARIDNTGKGFFNGGTQTGGADLAEAFEVEGLPEHYQPGDVLAISPESDRRMELSQEPYSTLVAGVYATKPGVLLSERDIDADHSDTVPMGVVGVLPTKVSGENGPIRRGDLLVTASLSGHAMKGTERERMLGAVIGKALENFDGSGTGVIKVLVNVK